jgi:HSP20 family protein
MKALSPWQPFAQLSTLHSDIDDLFTRFFGQEEAWGTPYGHMPAVETFMRDNLIVVRADLPGVDPKNVELSIEGDRLIIRGERKIEKKGGEAESTLKEVRYGRFERMLTLPQGVDPESVKATYEHGVLEVTMQAPKGAMSKKVPITVH